MRKNIKGFTLIELLAVIVILAIVLSIAIPTISKIIENSRDNIYIQNQKAMTKASQVFLVTSGNDTIYNIGDSMQIKLSTLISGHYIDNILDPKSKNICDTENSYVTVTKVANNKYTYDPILICENYGQEAVVTSDTTLPTLAVKYVNNNSIVINAEDENGFYFDGVDDYIDIPRMIDTDFTIEFQFKSPYTGIGILNNWYDVAGLIDAEINGFTNDFGIGINIKGQIMPGIGTNTSMPSTNTGLNDNAWHSVRFTRSATTTVGEIKLYIDNVLDNSKTSVSKLALTTPTRINIGRLLLAKNYFKGNIKNIRIWNTVTSSDMDQTLTGTEANLKAYYKFNELSGTVLTDYSNNGNNGTIYGNPAMINNNSTIKETAIYQNDVVDSYSTKTPIQKISGGVLEINNLENGRYTIVTKDRGNNVATKVINIISDNSSISFDGIDDYVDIPRMIDNDFTIEFQFKSNFSGIGSDITWYSAAGLIDAEVNGYTLDLGIGLNSYGQVISGIGQSNPDYCINSSPSFNNNLWHSVRFTRNYSATTGEIKLYVDDVLEKSLVTAKKLSLTTPKINIGRSLLGNKYFKGNIKNIRIWNSVTSSDMNQTLTGTEANLKAYYKFNEGSGTVLTDYSNSGNNGTIYGTPVWVP